jgi:hypothetical protein
MNHPADMVHQISEETHRELNTVRAHLSVMCHLSSAQPSSDMPTEDLVTILFDLLLS